MPDLSRLSVNHVTLLEQCSMGQFADALVRHGIGCASLWRDKVREAGVSETARLLAERGLALSGYCWGGLVTSPDQAEARTAVDEVRRALDEAAEVKAPCLVYVAGGVDPRDKDVAATRARALERTAELIPYARSVGVKIALEPLHPMACATRSVLSTTGLANDWCDQLGAEDVVGIALDTYAIWWDPKIEREIARAGRRICAFHISDWLVDTQDLRLDRGMMGDGLIDIAGLRRQVEAAGYEGAIEVEVFSRRNWWQRPPDEVLRVVKERFATAA
jgi:sugar phosphate isomerase/epimerase